MISKIQIFSILMSIITIICLIKIKDHTDSYQNLSIELNAVKANHYNCTNEVKNLKFYRNKLPKIGFILFGTGKYISLVDQLVRSMEDYFCINGKAHVKYFIFTDNTTYDPSNFFKNKIFRSYTKIHQKKLGWPDDSLKRFEIVIKQNKTLNFLSYDYLYWIDADMKMVDPICEDIFGDLVGTAHYYYPSSAEEYPYDYNIKSTAYVDQNNRFLHPYYVGAFYGGKSNEVMRLFSTCDQNIKKDFTEMNYTAYVEDESHLNRYFIDNHPTLILTKSYNYPEYPESFPWVKNYKKKIIAVDKDKDYFRS